MLNIYTLYIYFIKISINLYGPINSLLSDINFIKWSNSFNVNFDKIYVHFFLRSAAHVRTRESFRFSFLYKAQVIHVNKYHLLYCRTAIQFAYHLFKAYEQLINSVNVIHSSKTILLDYCSFLTTIFPDNRVADQSQIYVYSRTFLIYRDRRLSYRLSLLPISS